MTRIEAKREFWNKIYPEMFSRMNHYIEANKILDNGTVVDEFIDKIYDIGEFIDRQESKSNTDNVHLSVDNIESKSPKGIIMSWLNKLAMKIVVYNLKNDIDYRRSLVSSITIAQYDSKDPVSGSELFIDWLTR